MKTIYKNLLYTGILALSLGGLWACGEDESYDFPGDAMNRVYIKNSSSSYQFIHTPASTLGTLDFKMPVYATHKASANIKATVEIDNTLVEAYNKQNGKEFMTLPNNALLIKNGTMTILAGEKISSDSIHITINESALSGLRSKTGYLIPLKLTSAEGANASVSTNVNYAYLTINTRTDNDMINDDATENGAQGHLIEKRGDWTAFLVNETGIDVTGSTSAMFDGDEKTAWKASAAETFDFVVDLKKEYGVTAISAYYNLFDYYQYGTLLKDSKVQSSKNGSEWTSVGTVTSGGGWDSKSIIFYLPITARYFKFSVPLGMNWEGYESVSAQITEFRIYAK